MNVYKRGREYREMYWTGKSWGKYGDGRNLTNLFYHRFFLIPHQGILNITTADNLLSANAYVGYRRQLLNKTTMKDVLKDLQKNNIDVSQLVEFRAEQCQ